MMTQGQKGKVMDASVQEEPTRHHIFTLDVKLYLIGRSGIKGWGRPLHACGLDFMATPCPGAKACGWRLEFQCQMSFNDDRGMCRKSQQHMGGGTQQRRRQVWLSSYHTHTSLKVHCKCKHTLNDCASNISPQSGNLAGNDTASY